MHNSDKMSEKRFLKAKALYEQNRLDDALQIINEAISQDSKNLNLYHLRGRIFQELKKHQEAINDFKFVLQYFPNDIDILLDLSFNLYEMNKYHQAIEIYDKIIQIKRNHLKAYYNKSLILNELKEYEKALSTISKAFDLYPLEHDVLKLKAIILYNLNRFKESLECFERVLFFKPDDKICKYYIELLNAILK
ncbi:MAG: tetratricopeptide repeat protein [Candidatus Helarchaeota archaeon]